MATIRFTAAERPRLLARAVLDTLERLDRGDGDESDAMGELAQAFDDSDFKRFDELLSEHFRDVALAALGRPVPKVGVDPETGGEAAT